MASDKGAKRQKRTDSMGLGAMFEFDRSHELAKVVDPAEDELEGTYDRMLHQQSNAGMMLPQLTNDAPDVMRRQLSIDNLNNNRVAESIDDCFLERQTMDNQRGSMLFFGLAVVFGAVGMIGTSGIDLTDASGTPSSLSSGQRMRNSIYGSSQDDHCRVGATDDDNNMPCNPQLGNQDIGSDETSSPAYESACEAFKLLLQAIILMPQAFKLASFAFSMLFMLLWLNPMGYFFGKASKTSLYSTAVAN